MTGPRSSDDAQEPGPTPTEPSPPQAGAAPGLPDGLAPVDGGRQLVVAGAVLAAIAALAGLPLLLGDATAPSPVAPGPSAPAPADPPAPIASDSRVPAATSGAPGSSPAPRAAGANAAEVRALRAAERAGQWPEAARGWAALHERTGERKHLENLLVASLVALRELLGRDRPDDGLALVEELLGPRRDQPRARETLATAYRRLAVHQTQAIRLAAARDVARRLGALGPPWDADARLLLDGLGE